MLLKDDPAWSAIISNKSFDVAFLFTLPSLINNVLLVVAVSFLYSSPPAIDVAGEKIKKIGTSFFTTEIRDEVTKPLDIAQAVAAIIPTYGGHCNFSVIHHFQGVRKVDGLIYGNKKFGFFYIINNIGMMTKVVLEEGVYKLVGA